MSDKDKESLLKTINDAGVKLIDAIHNAGGVEAHAMQAQAKVEEAMHWARKAVEEQS